jgi:hypothetical protein
MKPSEVNKLTVSMSDLPWSGGIVEMGEDGDVRLCQERVFPASR